VGKGKQIVKIIPFGKTDREYRIRSNSDISENLSADLLVFIVIVDVEN